MSVPQFPSRIQYHSVASHVQNQRVLIKSANGMERSATTWNSGSDSLEGLVIHFGVNQVLSCPCSLQIILPTCLLSSGRKGGFRETDVEVCQELSNISTALFQSKQPPNTPVPGDIPSSSWEYRTLEPWGFLQGQGQRCRAQGVPLWLHAGNSLCPQDGEMAV